MHKVDFTQDSANMLPKDSSKSRHKMKQSLLKCRQGDSLCLNQSELKHMHAIKPYCSKQRISSRRQSSQNKSPYELNRSKSRRFDSSSRKNQDNLGERQMSEMYSELISLKSEYKTLKSSYNMLILQKEKSNARQKEERDAMKAEKERWTVQIQKSKRTIQQLQQQIERIKRQCYKIVDMERFKLNKIQQTVQEKDLMIAYLRNQIQTIKKGTPETNHPLSFLQNNQPVLTFDYFSKPNNISALSNIPLQMDVKPQHRMQQDSLSFSRDKSKEMDSIMQSFLSNHDQPQPETEHNFVKKEKILISSLQQSPIQQEDDEQKSQNNLPQPSKLSAEQKDQLMKNKQTISVKHKNESRGRLKQRKLQIMLGDQNVDTINNTEEVCNDTKRKMMTNSGALGYKQKKKSTAKKYTYKS